MSVLTNPEALKKFERAYVMIEPDLPRCSVAAISWLAQAAGVTLPTCLDKACDHPKLPEGFGRRLTRGTSVARCIALIESECKEAR